MFNDKGKPLYSPIIPSERVIGDITTVSRIVLAPIDSPSSGTLVLALVEHS